MQLLPKPAYFPPWLGGRSLKKQTIQTCQPSYETKLVVKSKSSKKITLIACGDFYIFKLTLVS